MRTLYLASAAAMAMTLAACGNENNVEPEDTAAAEEQQERGVVAAPEGEGDGVMADADTMGETEPMVGEAPAPDAGMEDDTDMAMDDSMGDDTAAPMGPVTVTFETTDAVTGSGTADLSYAESAGALMMTVDVTGFPPGEHGIHLHETGDCSAADFTSAGGHVGKDMAQHGLDNPEGPEAGDLPNLEVGEDGSATQEFSTDRVTLYEPEGDTPALMDADGSAIVIHAQADDQTTQPIGGAGDRIACAVIESQS